MRVKAKFVTNLLVAALTGVAFAAVAGGSGKSGELTMQHKELMNKLDANQDGVISQSEASANPELAKQFRELDRDANQKLEKAEFARFEVTESTEGDR